jgi:integrase
MASLRARHSKNCALGGRETAGPRFEGDKISKEIDGRLVVCSGKPTCQPTYSIRGAAGDGHEHVGKNLRQALRKLAKKNDDENPEPIVGNIRFEAWADEWLTGLHRPSERTIDGYRRTIAYANDAFGNKFLRSLSGKDITDFLSELADRKRRGDKDWRMSASTKAQHLRVLHACFEAAIKADKMTRNPVGRLSDSQRPRAEKKESAYFTDDELPRLLAELPEGLWRTLVRVALATGMREGELSALTWGDVDLTGGTIRVRRSFSGGRLGQTKGRLARTVDLPAETTELLGEWWGLAGKPDDSELVFPREDGGGYQPYWRFSKVLYAAMKRAGITREGPTGEERTFHSTRHTYARIVLEQGIPISWLSRQLGHSSEAVTDGHYGHWSRARSQEEAKRLKGVFAI